MHSAAVPNVNGPIASERGGGRIGRLRAAATRTDPHVAQMAPLLLGRDLQMNQKAGNTLAWMSVSPSFWNPGRWHSRHNDARWTLRTPPAALGLSYGSADLIAVVASALFYIDWESFLLHHGKRPIRCGTGVDTQVPGLDSDSRAFRAAGPGSSGHL